MILSEAAGSSGDFTQDVQRIMRKLFPEYPLEHLPADHPVYSILYPFEEVGYTDYVASLGETPPPLPLEAVQVGGTTAVVYCPYGLGGWRGFDDPFGRDVSCRDALKLGMNIVLYAMTH
jgi:hypothetical protein